MAVVVSAHLDDAVLSAAHAIATRPGSVLVTAFANGPRTVDPLPDWDQRSGAFAPGDDVIAARRGEDAAAAAVLGATSIHLGLWDRHYRDAAYGYCGPTDAGDLATAVATELANLAQRSGNGTWIVPLGVRHPDHQITAHACRLLAAQFPRIEWLVYDDLPYSAENDQDVEAALARVRATGFDLTPMSDDDHHGTTASRKARAVECYTSQLAALGPRIQVSIDSPERLRRLVGDPLTS
jgi:LmbE family N-acetylglucosaminyl deacetylase